jgi:hypothetical protein
MGLAELVNELPRLDYDELQALRRDLETLSIEGFRVIPVLKKAARTQGNWAGVGARELIDRITRHKPSRADAKTFSDEMYWWLIVFGVLRFVDIDNWWDGKDTWKNSCEYAEIAPRGIALLNDLSVDGVLPAKTPTKHGAYKHSRRRG